MKKLIFIDNDNLKSCQEDADTVKSNLELHGGLSEEYVETLELYPDFYHMRETARMELLFDEDSAICTYSMYTASHFDSLSQFLVYLKVAATRDVENKVYIDASGKLFSKKYIFDTELLESKAAALILQAIETNYILTHDGDKFLRLRVKLQGLQRPYIIYEEIDLNECLQ